MAFEPKTHRFYGDNTPEYCYYVCQMDGSYFIPALVSGRLLSNIQRELAINKKAYSFDIWLWSNHSFALWFFENGEFLLFEEGSDEALRKPVLTVNQYWEVRSMDDLRVLWRPVLIPTDQYGNFDKNARTDNPNGSIVAGGGLYVDGQEWHWQHHNPPQKGKVSIGDTGTFPMTWFWWNGVMVSLYTIGKIHLETLWENNLIGPICTEDYQERGRIPKWTW